jgi:hypothetical protein
MAAPSYSSLTERGELPKSGELRERLSRRTRSVADTFDELRSEIRDATDWRTQAARHPYWAAAAAGGALLLAFKLLQSRRPHPRERVLNAMADGLEEVAGRLRSRRRSRMGSAFGTSRILNAVLAAAARRALRRRWSASLPGRVPYSSRG